MIGWREETGFIKNSYSHKSVCFSELWLTMPNKKNSSKSTWVPFNTWEAQQKALIKAKLEATKSQQEEKWKPKEKPWWNFMTGVLQALLQVCHFLHFQNSLTHTYCVILQILRFRFFRPFRRSDRKVHEITLVDLEKSHVCSFITKALNLLGGTENNQTSQTLITISWPSHQC